jgi:hypothetical protein
LSERWEGRLLAEETLVVLPKLAAGMRKRPELDALVILRGERRRREAVVSGEADMATERPQE